MNSTTPIAVWSYLVVATLLEWALAKNFLSLSTIYTNIVLAVLAASQILIVALVFLRLKYEPRGIVGIAAASLFFAVLAVVLALGSIGH
jgi:heme/copper-type cytochrome/quinol oxidase subunit 4